MVMMMMITSVLRMVQPLGMNGVALSNILAQPCLASVNLEMVIKKWTFLIFSINEQQNMPMKVKVVLPAKTLPQV